MAAWSTVSRSERQTRNWGKKLAPWLKRGDIVGLSGELGAGKTSFVRGIAEGLGVGADAWIRSPTFTLINEYHGRVPIYHIDLYRVSGRADQETLDLREYLYGEGVALVEWFEYLAVEEAEEFLEITFVHAGPRRRRLTFSARGKRYEEILERLKNEAFDGPKSARFAAQSL
jgi:tRNA threonylcarbamoyladenosine biosynthesis protein TsaE